MATILESLVGSCAKKLQHIITEEAILILGVKKELTELQRRMEQIRHFLTDAEKRGINESAVKNWLGQLRDTMFDADDIIDLARSKGNKLLLDHSLLLSRRLNRCSGVFLLSCFSNIQIRHEVAVQIRRVNRRIDNISKDNVFLSLTNTESTGTVSAPKLRRSSSLVEPNLAGKEVIHACRKLVDLVLKHKENKSYKIAIIGTGGVGKTTLAQKIYNDQKIKGLFNKLAWVCVSKDYSEVAILQEILRRIEVNYMPDESTEELQSKLEQAIKEKNFFLVLDDVWKSDTWTNLLRIPLYSAATGIVLLTSQLDTVAVEIGVDYTHRVDLMSMDVGWELLWKSLDVIEEKEVQNLRDIGIDIVRRCGGLPLAIKVIARVLASKDQTENEWKKILGKNAWSVGKLPSEITGALYVSYEELPHPLKQCFIYCAMYPEGAVLRRDDIVRMWVAEGFIEEQDSQLLEDTAEEYYYELIYRNLLHPEYLTFDLRECRVHDLLRMLACHLSREECFVGDTELIGVNIMGKFRRITLDTAKDRVILPNIDKDLDKVRTLRTSYKKALRIENTVFKRFPKIRVLDLTDSVIQSVPSCIGCLIHLRLLDLDGTDISSLPKSICCLVNLQTLNLQMCHALRSLPSGITQLHNLRRLGLEDTPINQVPQGISKLTSLNDLQGFLVSGGCHNITRMQDGWSLEELGPLSQLRKLSLIKLERALHCRRDLLIIDKMYLRQLSLECTECTDIPYSEDDIINIERTFENLIPPYIVEDLTIWGFFGTRYPTWLYTNVNLSNVLYLKLVNCKSCVSLPPIGQLPNLKYLKLEGGTLITKIGPELIGNDMDNPGSTNSVAFPKLETFLVSDMPNWEEWTFVADEEKAIVTIKEGGKDAGPTKKMEESPPTRMHHLPRLKELELVCCPKLRALPPQLGQKASSFQKLYLRYMSSLRVVENLPALSEMLLIDECESLERVSNLPHVRQLHLQLCLNLRRVEKLDNLQELFLTEDMRDVSSEWLYGLQEQQRKLHGEELDVYTW